MEEQGMKAMGRILNNAAEAVGGTPLVEFCNIENEFGLKGRLLVKLECMNPAGSVKDRAARELIRDAEEKGLLKPGAAIIEPTSGNTGIGLASVAAIRGYELILTMPDTMSVERVNILKAYGAKIVLTPGARGMAGAIEKASELAAEIPGSFIPGQFVNPANAAAHYKTTGPEIWLDTDGGVDIFVASVGTGGTITGTGRYLKERNPLVKVVAVEPETSAVLSGKEAGAHSIQGIGAGFIPEALDTGIYDEVITVNNEEPFAMARLIAQKEGVLVGISSGAALCAAVQILKRKENEGKMVVAVLPDHGDRYYSTSIFGSED